MDAGARLRIARRRAGLSQRGLAARTGVPQSSIARIERNATIPRVDSYQRLLEATGHSLEVEARLGEGVDRSLIRTRLAMTPAARARAAAVAARNVSAFLTQARVRGKPSEG